MAKEHTNPSPGYAEASFGLRPPRVAIVFPAETTHWTYFAHKALWRASQLWGGSGFVLVPHKAGQVSSNLLRAAAAYDPDYVVPLQITWRELIEYIPGTLDRMQHAGGRPVSNEFLEGFLEQEGDSPASDDMTARARDIVAAACQVYRRRGDTSTPPPNRGAVPRWDQAWSRPDESLVSIEDPTEIDHALGFASLLMPVTVFGDSELMCLAVPPKLGGPWGPMAAALAGAVRPPEPPTPDGGSTTGNDDDHKAMCSWFYSHLDFPSAMFRPKPPDALLYHPDGLKLGVDTAQLSKAWDRTRTGLVSVHDGLGGRRATIVVGDTADDFALALMYDRIWGNGLWIHSEWAPGAAGKVGAAARTGLSLLYSRFRRLNNTIVTSASVQASDLTEISELISDYPAVSISSAELQTEDAITLAGTASSPADLSGGGAEATADQTEDPDSWSPEIELPPRFDARGLGHLAIDEDFSTRLTLPVIRAELATSLVSLPPAFAPSQPKLASVRGLTWHVDLSLNETDMPLGRSLDGHVLAASSDEEWETWIRSGNRSVSYESRKFDWVPAVASHEQRTARPRIGMLTLQGWCRAMANQAGYDVGWSDAGRRALLLEEMWGDRDLLTKDFTGTFTELVELFNQRGKGSADAYPNGEGVYIAGVGGFLRFNAIRDILAPEQTEPSTERSGTTELDRRTSGARDQLDSYLARGIIRRGLLLGCGVCEQLNFIAIDDLGQQTTCQRCGALTQLTREAWRQPDDEPTWFYDLHQVARTLVQEHGHAPMWLAQHLAKKARNYSDCAELNLLVPGTRTSRAEVDLVAHADRNLVTAEVKTSNTLGSKAERTAAAKKRVLWASVLHADEILLATTQATWEPSSIEVMRLAITDAIKANAFAPDRHPRLRTITNLRRDNCTEAYIDVTF